MRAAVYTACLAWPVERALYAYHVTLITSLCQAAIDVDLVWSARYFQPPSDLYFNPNFPQQRSDSLAERPSAKEAPVVERILPPNHLQRRWTGRWRRVR